MSEINDEFIFESEEFDEEFYFDYDGMSNFEKHDFQNFYTGEYNKTLLRIFASIQKLMQDGVIEKDSAWRYSDCNKITVRFADRYIVVLALEDSIAILNNSSRNKIRVPITSNSTADINNVAKFILELQ